MAAQALEQSVLESKDKEQLLAIAKALGVKATARTKKAEIIDQILASTSPGVHAAAAARPADDSGDPADSADSAGRPADDASDQPSDRPAGRAGSESSPAAAPLVRSTSRPAVPAAVDEPPAEWELDSAGDDESPAASADRGASNAAERTNGARQAEVDQRSSREPSRPQSNQPVARQPIGQPAGPGTAAQHPTPNSPSRDDSGGQGDDGDGESRNRRRRRRRKGKGGEGGGDERESFETAPSSNAGTSNAGTSNAGNDGSPSSDDVVEVSGHLDLRDEGYGFLRVKGYLAHRDDSYVPVKLTRQFGLRKGDHITGISRAAVRNEKNPALLEIHTVNGGDPEAARERPKFEDLTALFPDSRLHLENRSDPADMTTRIIDLVAPIGKGQRGIIVSPPKAGKTTIMKSIATAIERNNPEVKLMVLLIDERPEEVTDMRRTVKGEVISSTFDRPSEEHTHVAEMTIERAKRLVELGEDVVIILDGITRLSRAYNLAAPTSGKILSGGIDAGALYPPKKFFGAARNVEEGGSLTILATALVETNSRMDDAIFEEFKGTGNMELRLDRRLAERRVFPAIDVDASSTRHEELLFDRKQLQQVWKLRRVLSGLAADGSSAPGLELLIDRLRTFKNNDEFLNEIAKQPSM